jgi:SAM-dependent methyltransferase
MAKPDFSPSAERNKQPILDVLQAILPAQGAALEIASGTGQHVEWFATHLPQWTWQPSDLQRGALYNIEVRAAEAGLDNVLEPLLLDVQKEPWFAEARSFDLIYCANMLHIAPWQACTALMQGCARHLAPDGLLVTYGPYFEQGVDATPGNVEFDQSLRAHDPAWGIRLLQDVDQEANKAGLHLRDIHRMPANNLLLVFAKAGDNHTP